MEHWRRTLNSVLFIKYRQFDSSPYRLQTSEFRPVLTDGNIASIRRTVQTSRRAADREDCLLKKQTRFDDARRRQGRCSFSISDCFELGCNAVCLYIIEVIWTVVYDEPSCYCPCKYGFVRDGRQHFRIESVPLKHDKYVLNIDYFIRLTKKKGFNLWFASANCSRTNKK